MSWTDILIAVKKGIVASAESVANIISGTTKVGNADKLDGFHADAFLFGNGATVRFNPVADLNDFHTGIGLFSESIANIPESTWWLVISGGDASTQMQIASSFFNDKPVKERYCTGGVWGSWNNISTGHLALTGGDLNGSVRMYGNGLQTRHIDGYGSDGANDLFLNYSNIDAQVYVFSNGTSGSVLHTGNSRPVVVSTTAPADTSSVWIVP